MKAKVFRSGDKNFEEEKAKMFGEELNKGLTKEEQLKSVFTRLFAGLLIEYDLIKFGGATKNETELKEKYTNIFLREVKIRVKL